MRRKSRTEPLAVGFDGLVDGLGAHSLSCDAVALVDNASEFDIVSQTGRGSSNGSLLRGQ